MSNSTWNELKREIQKEFGHAKIAPFSLPLILTTEVPYRGKEIKWGYKRVVLKDKFGKEVKALTVKQEELSQTILALYALGIKTEKYISEEFGVKS